MKSGSYILLSGAPKMDACRTAIKHLFHFWGGTPVLDVCIRKPSLVSPTANVTARTKQYSTNTEQSGFVLFRAKKSIGIYSEIKLSVFSFFVI